MSLTDFLSPSTLIRVIALRALIRSERQLYPDVPELSYPAIDDIAPEEAPAFRFQEGDIVTFQGAVGRVRKVCGGHLSVQVYVNMGGTFILTTMKRFMAASEVALYAPVGN